MGQQELENIRKIFDELGIKPEYFEHEAVITSEDAAKTRDFELKQGIKAILFTDDNNQWVIVDSPADRKIDAKKVAQQLGWSKSRIRIATLEEVMKMTNCDIGAVPPFGSNQQIPILVDRGVYDNQESVFNIGLRTHSVRIKTELMRKVFEKARAIEGDFSKIKIKNKK
jgi:Ala-tRNA(Pro) deacylase